MSSVNEFLLEYASTVIRAHVKISKTLILTTSSSKESSNGNLLNKISLESFRAGLSNIIKESDYTSRVVQIDFNIIDKVYQYHKDTHEKYKEKQKVLKLSTFTPNTKSKDSAGQLLPVVEKQKVHHKESNLKQGVSSLYNEYLCSLDKVNASGTDNYYTVKEEKDITEILKNHYSTFISNFTNDLVDKSTKFKNYLSENNKLTKDSMIKSRKTALKKKLIDMLIQSSRSKLSSSSKKALLPTVDSLNQFQYKDDDSFEAYVRRANNAVEDVKGEPKPVSSEVIADSGKTNYKYISNLMRLKLGLNVIIEEQLPVVNKLQNKKLLREESKKAMKRLNRIKKDKHKNSQIFSDDVDDVKLDLYKLKKHVASSSKIELINEQQAAKLNSGMNLVVIKKPQINVNIQESLNVSESQILFSDHLLSSPSKLSESIKPSGKQASLCITSGKPGKNPNNTTTAMSIPDTIKTKSNFHLSNIKKGGGFNLTEDYSDPKTFSNRVDQMPIIPNVKSIFIEQKNNSRLNTFGDISLSSTTRKIFGNNQKSTKSKLSTNLNELLDLEFIKKTQIDIDKLKSLK